MATRIRGITIELSSDTTGLIKGLNNANKSAKETQRALKDVEKVLKFNPGNTELLAQKQKLLKQNVEETKKQLDAEKKALDELQNAGDSDKTIQQQEALARQIAETEAKLKDAESALKGFGSVGAQQLAAIGEKMQELGGKITEVGENLTKYVSLPIAAFFGASAKSALSFEDSMAKVHTLVNDNTASIEDLTDGIMDLSNETGRSGTELAEAMYQALSASVDVNDSLEFTRTAARLAKAGFLETSGAVDVLSTVINAYKMEASDAQYISDLLVQTQNDGKTTVNELAANMGTVIPTAAAYNVSLENLTTSYALMTKNGINTNNATTMINSTLTELARDGSEVATILREKTGKSFGELMNDGASLGDVLQILYDDVGGNAEAFANLWGNVRAGRGALVLAQSGAEGFNTELDKMYDASGNVDTALEKLDTPAAQLKRSWNELKNVSVDLGMQLVDLLIPVLEQFSEAVKKISEWWNNLSPGMQQAIIKVGLLAAALGPIISIGGKLTSGIGGILKSAPKIVGVVGTIGTFLTGSLVPAIGGVIAAAAPILAAAAPFIAVGAAIVGAGVLVYKNWDKIKTKAGELKEKVSQKWGELKEKTSETWANIKESVGTKWSEIKQNTSEKLSGMSQNIGEKLGNWRESFSTKFGSIKESVGTNLSAALATSREKLASMGSNMTTKLSSWRESWANRFNAIKSSVATNLSGSFQATKDKMASMSQNMAGHLGNYVNAFKNRFVSIKSAVSNNLVGAASVVSSKMEAIRNSFSSKLSSAYSTVSSLISRIKGLFNFSWSLPRLKLPHVSISGKFGINPPSAPHFSISWYKKAMNNGMILDGPTIFGMDNRGNLLGGGEAGKEAIIGVNSLMGMISSAAGGGINENAIYNAVREGASNAHISVYIDGQDVTDLVNAHNTSRQLNRLKFSGA